MPTVHLVHGFLGAGKTQFARLLEQRTGALRLSADEWYLLLFAGDEPTSHLDDVLWRRMMRVLEDVWTAVAARGVDVVLDLGFWSRAMRDRARALAASVDAEVVLYQVVCDDAVARSRCVTRNAAPGSSFLIHASAFDELKAKFEPLGPDEPATVVDTT